MPYRTESPPQQVAGGFARRGGQRRRSQQRAREAALANRPQTPGGRPWLTPPLRVLIVDDEAPARRRLRELLDDCAAALPLAVVGEAQNGREASSCCNRCPRISC